MTFVILRTVGSMLFLGILVAVAAYFLKPHLTSASTPYNPYLVLGNLAQRMGMTVTRGSPQLDCMYLSMYDSVDLGAEGAPYQVPLAFRVSVESERRFSSFVRRTLSYVSATAATPFPPFEVVSRVAPMLSIQRKLELTERLTGSPEVDTRYAVYSESPAMAALLGELLPCLGTFDPIGVHLVGDGRDIVYRLSMDRSPFFGNVLYFADELAAKLSYLARRIGG